ncbi:hypothetical protein CHUAL_012651 [Chamberlinius hualienensis]
MLSPIAKHLCHCMLCIIAVVVVEFIYGGIRFGESKPPDFNPFEKYGYVAATLLYLLRFLPFMALPQTVANFLGMILYNAFPDKVKLKGSPLLAPFICIRTVTRGDFPELVRQNVMRNINTCLDVGLENFMVDVVTDKPLNLPKHARVREIVVPTSYQTKSGALFKARALQYCLEDDVNLLGDNDWVVHLDEESTLTENSVKGILNFVLDGKSQFGQGLITYANEEVVNWLTTLADSYRVAEDMGKLRFQFNVFKKPVFSWKGSYVVSQLGAERKVTYDNGIDGSIAEDCYFGMSAAAQGYVFSFIEGEIWEKSPFTIWDFIQQRKRWMQGIYLVVHDSKIPIRTKFFIGISLYSWLALPFITSNIVFQELYPVPCWQLMDILTLFLMGTNMYMYLLGVMKSFSLYRYGLLKFSMCLIGAMITVPFNVMIENVAVIWGCFGNKHRFYVVKKEIKPPVVV